MKTSFLILAAASLEVPWPVVVILGLAILFWLWLILRRPFRVDYTDRDRHVVFTNQSPPENPESGIAKTPPTPAVPKSQPTTPETDTTRAA
jgi:hypothetical protein